MLVCQQMTKAFLLDHVKLDGSIEACVGAKLRGLTIVTDFHLFTDQFPCPCSSLFSLQSDLTLFNWILNTAILCFCKRSQTARSHQVTAIVVKSCEDGNKYIIHSRVSQRYEDEHTNHKIYTCVRSSPLLKWCFVFSGITVFTNVDGITGRACGTKVWNWRFKRVKWPFSISPSYPLKLLIQ